MPINCVLNLPVINLPSSPASIIMDLALFTLFLWSQISENSDKHLSKKHEHRYTLSLYTLSLYILSPSIHFYSDLFIS